MRVMITGAAGLLGAAVVREFQSDSVAAFDRAALELCDEPAVAAAVARVSPDLLVNCAAYNDVDAAEEQAGDALRVNAFAVLSLARAAASSGATFVHYSTDFVFDGGASRPYTEEDGPSPRSVYGASKLLGDWFALEHPRSYVLRVESLFGTPGPASRRRGSLGTIVEHIRAGREVPVFTDRTVSPSFTADVARATRALVKRNAPGGLYHCVNSGLGTWAEIAAKVAAILGRPLHARLLTLDKVSLKASRPRYCALSNEKLKKAGIEMPHWSDALQAYLRDDS
jgi:dTDP-4-dehydrorhamnose reductase